MHPLQSHPHLLNQDLFTQLNSSWKQKQNADKNFFEKDFAQKREALRRLAVQPELEDILEDEEGDSAIDEYGNIVDLSLWNIEIIVLILIILLIQF